MGQVISLDSRRPPKPLTEGKRAVYHNPATCMRPRPEPLAFPPVQQYDRCCKCGRACHSLNWGEMDSKTVTCVYCVDDRDMTDEGL